MTSATTLLHHKLFECCLATTIPRTRFTISKPYSESLFTKQTHFARSSVSLKSKLFPKIVPFIAQTSDFAQQEENEYESGETVEANATEVRHDGSFSGGLNEEYRSTPTEEAKLFVGNLDYEIDCEKLAALFNEAGVVEIAEVIYNRDTDRSRGFGFVTMSTVEEADKAAEMFNGYELNGRSLTVNRAAERGSTPLARAPRSYEPSFKLYIGNLPWTTDDAQLEQICSEHGKVISAKVVLDRESGRSRGFGFVAMSSESELNDVIAALDGQDLDGRQLRVNRAEDRPPRRNSF